MEVTRAPPRLPQRKTEGQLREPAASHPIQQQLSLGLFYILKFYVTYHLKEGSFCLAGKMFKIH